MGLPTSKIKTVELTKNTQEVDITFWDKATLSGWSGTAQQLHDALLFAAVQPESTKNHQNEKVRSIFGGE